MNVQIQKDIYFVASTNNKAGIHLTSFNPETGEVTGADVINPVKINTPISIPELISFGDLDSDQEIKDYLCSLGMESVLSDKMRIY